MDCNRAFVIPESWSKEASKLILELNKAEPVYSIIPVPKYEKLSKKCLKQFIEKALRMSNLRSVVVVLPKSYANGLQVKFWPDMLIRQETEILVTSVVFADIWSECQSTIDSWMALDFPLRSREYNASCQYQPPYTDTLKLWVEKGAKNFHPGDYFKHEFLLELRKMQGHWLYWGHADHKQLRGYSNLTAENLVCNKPKSPLHSTLWFSCGTLQMNEERSIALEWFLNEATYCILASTAKVKTLDNQILGSFWLEICKLSPGLNIADVIHCLIKNNKQNNLEQTLANYRLIGLPWINFS